MESFRVVDFRRPRWGHNLMSVAWEEDGIGTALAISTPRVKIGDTILWTTNYGYVEAEVIDSKPYRDPIDMTKVFVRVTKRVADPEIVSQEEIDNLFS